MPAMPTARCQATAPECQDQQIMQLRLFTDPNPDGFTEEGAAPTFTTRVDARAGGLMPTRSFVYLSFSETGMVKRDLGDEAALASTDWDLALRRYVIRLNSGVSGSSCVEAARTAP